MRLGRSAATLGAVTAALALGVAPARADTPIAGYETDVVASGLNRAIALDWTPDGRMLIAEKDGVLKVRNTTGSVATVLDLRARVNNNTDRGLTGVAVDTDYATNNFVYLFYTYDALANSDDPGPKRSRLTRIVLKPDNKVAQVNTAPETVILGSLPPAPGGEACPAPNNNIDCLPADGNTHVNGTVRSAPDGTLYVGSGDAAFGAQNTPDPFRPLNPNSLAGKILHIDRNGNGVPGHPLCPDDTTLTHVCTKVFAQGFRNPFRFNLATRGGLWAGDVGENLYEELDHVVAGKSYGWPCYEGPIRNAARAGNEKCQAAYAAGLQRGPVFSYSHDSHGACIIAGPEIRSSKYPADWQGTVVAGDVVNGWLDRMTISGTDQFTGRSPLATGWHGADLRLGPDGLLYSAEFFGVVRLKPETGNRPPEARATVTPYAGLAPLQTTFDATASTDPDGDALTYAWNFGDGSSGTGSRPTHTYVANGHYTATVTVTDGHGGSATESVLVVVGTRPPQISFVQPAAGYRYSDGVRVDMQVSATDPEDGTLPPQSIAWSVVLQHNEHQHYLGDFTGWTASFTPLVTHDADSYYLVRVTATDSDGVATTVERRLDPQTVRLELAVSPAAPADIVYDSAPHAAPYVKQAAVGYQTTVVAPDTIRDSSGELLVFVGWSDGGAAAHQISVPAADTTLVASYAVDTTPPETTITGRPGTANANHQPQFTFTSNEPGTFQCAVDDFKWTACASPWRTPFQKVGTHKFRVRAIDHAGNSDPTPAAEDFVVRPTV